MSIRAPFWCILGPWAAPGDENGCLGALTLILGVILNSLGHRSAYCTGEGWQKFAGPLAQGVLDPELLSWLPSPYPLPSGVQIPRSVETSLRRCRETILLRFPKPFGTLSFSHLYLDDFLNRFFLQNHSQNGPKMHPKLYKISSLIVIQSRLRIFLNFS